MLTSPTLTLNSAQNSYISDFFHIFDLVLQKRLPNLFELLIWHQKTTFWRPLWRFFIRSFVAALVRRHLRFWPVLLLLLTTHAWEKSRWAMVPVQCSASQHSDQFLVQGYVQCGGRQVLSRAGHLLFLSVLMLPHHSGQIPETAAFYTYMPNTGRGEFTPRESEVKTERTLVVYGLLGPWLN